jgi:hypothetical protein
MSPVKDSQDDHWKRKISWKYHSQAKSDIILQEKIIRGSALNTWKRYSEELPQPWGCGMFMGCAVLT